MTVLPTTGFMALKKGLPKAKDKIKDFFKKRKHENLF